LTYIELDLLTTEIFKKQFASFTPIGIHQLIRVASRKEKTHLASRFICVVDPNNYL